MGSGVNYVSSLWNWYTWSVGEELGVEYVTEQVFVMTLTYCYTLNRTCLRRDGVGWTILPSKICLAPWSIQTGDRDYTLKIYGVHWPVFKDRAMRRALWGLTISCKCNLSAPIYRSLTYHISF